MRIDFLTFAPIETDTNGRLSSTAASARYRVLAPAAALGMEHEVHVHSTEGIFWDTCRELLTASKRVVLSKSFDARSEELVQWLLGRGCYVIFDVCDNHYEIPHLRNHYLRLTRLASAVTVNTGAMAHIIRNLIGREAAVIDDPVLGTRRRPRFSPGKRVLRALWFGHPSNLDSLLALLPSLAAFSRERSVELTLVTGDPGPFTERLATAITQHAGLYSGLVANVLPWSERQVEESLEGCDLVLIPSLQTAFKDTKSANRLAETLWAGRLAIAHPLPSYSPFGNFARIGADITGLLRQALQDPAREEARIIAGQRHIAAHLQPAQIASQWEAVLQAS